MNVDPLPRPTARRVTRPSSRASRRVTGLLVAAGLAVSAAACSSDSTTTAGGATSSLPSVSASSERGTSTSSARGTTSSTATTGTSRGTTSTTRRNGTSSTRDPNVLTPPSIEVNATPGNEEYCTKVATALQELTNVALEAIGGGGSADQLLPQVKSLYADLADTAPAEIKDDVEVLSSKLQTISTADELDKLGTDPDATAAGERFTAWIKRECGFDPNGS